MIKDKNDELKEKKEKIDDLGELTYSIFPPCCT